MKQDNRKKRKDRQATALERILSAFGLQSLRQASKAMKISKSTISRALNRSKPTLLAKAGRRKVLQFLGRQCESEKALRELIEEVGWDLEEGEWEEALACLGVRQAKLYDVPFLSLDRVVGQEKAFETIRAWLLNERRDVERVMVVRGVGGVGKTVLAIRVVMDAGVQERYQDGVFWMDVARDGETESIRHLVRRLGEKETGQLKNPWRAARDAMRGRRVVLVLDGMEEEINLARWNSLLPRQGRLLVTKRGRGVMADPIKVQELVLKGLKFEAARELLTRDVVIDVSEEDLAWVVESVSGLPLALHIGNRVAKMDGMLRGLVDDLRDVGLEGLESGELESMGVRKAFESSYKRLDSQGQTVFKALGVGLPWFDVDVAAAVATSGGCGTGGQCRAGDVSDAHLSPSVRGRVRPGGRAMAGLAEAVRAILSGRGAGCRQDGRFREGRRVLIGDVPRLLLRAGVEGSGLGKCLRAMSGGVCLPGRRSGAGRAGGGPGWTGRPGGAGLFSSTSRRRSSGCC